MPVVADVPIRLEAIEALTAAARRFAAAHREHSASLDAIVTTGTTAENRARHRQAAAELSAATSALMFAALMLDAPG